MVNIDLLSTRYPWVPPDVLKQIRATLPKSHQDLPCARDILALNDGRQPIESTAAYEDSLHSYLRLFGKEESPMDIQDSNIQRALGVFHYADWIQEDPTSSPEELIPGNILRFSPVKIRLDAEQVLIYTGDAPDPPPKKDVAPTCLRRIKVGTMMDGAPVIYSFHMITGELHIFWNQNEPVFLEITECATFWSLIRHPGVCVTEEYIQFDEPFESHSKREDLAAYMAMKLMIWQRAYVEERAKAKRKWRNATREYEIKLLQREWPRNKAIFPPNTTDETIDRAIQDLRDQSDLDVRSGYRMKYIG